MESSLIYHTEKNDSGYAIVIRGNSLYPSSLYGGFTVLHEVGIKPIKPFFRQSVFSLSSRRTRLVLLDNPAVADHDHSTEHVFHVSKLIAICQTQARVGTARVTTQPDVSVDMWTEKKINQHTAHCSG